MKPAAVLALTCCLVSMFVGCHSHNPNPNGARTIAIITPAGSNEFNADLCAGADAQAKLLGWNPIKHLSPTGNADDSELVGLALQAIAQKPDAISVCGMGDAALQQVVKRANRDGVPIFVHNQITPTAGDVEAYLGYDEYDAGRKCGDYALELLANYFKDRQPAGQVAILDGSPGDHTSQRANGFREAFRYAGNVQVVEEKSADWSKEKADKLVAGWLKQYPGLLLIFACNDKMAMGARHAVATFNFYGGNRNIQVMGFGGTHDALVEVKYGDLASTLAVEPRKMGSRIINQMMDSFEGSESAHRGTIIRMDTTVVNANNLDAFMGGFAAPPPPPSATPNTSSPSAGDNH